MKADADLIYNVFWTLVTIGLSIYCIYEYALDKDATQVGFRSFQDTEEDNYPSISICFMWPYDTTKLAKVESKCGVSYITLLGIIAGEVSFDVTSCNFTYDEITLDLNEHLFEATIYGLGSNSKFKGHSNFYVSYRSSEEKCFGIDIPFVEKQWISFLMLSLNVTAFWANPSNSRYFRIMSHYPNQNMVTEFNSFEGLALYFSKDDKTFVRRMSYNVAVVQVDVVKRRNKLSEKCNPDWKNHDQFILNEIIREVGCQPFYLPPIPNHRICKTKKEHHAFDFITRAIKNQTHPHIKPCKKIEKIFYDSEWTYEEKDMETIIPAEEMETPFYLQLVFQGNTYKIIEHVKDYTFQTLIGTVGGYVGMFLGYSFLDMPSLIKSINRKFISRREK